MVKQWNWKSELIAILFIVLKLIFMLHECGLDPFVATGRFSRKMVLSKYVFPRHSGAGKELIPEAEFIG